MGEKIICGKQPLSASGPNTCMCHVDPSYLLSTKYGDTRLYYVLLIKVDMQILFFSA